MISYKDISSIFGIAMERLRGLCQHGKQIIAQLLPTMWEREFPCWETAGWHSYSCKLVVVMQKRLGVVAGRWQNQLRSVFALLHS